MQDAGIRLGDSIVAVDISILVMELTAASEEVKYHCLVVVGGIPN